MWNLINPYQTLCNVMLFTEVIVYPITGTIFIKINFKSVLKNK